MPGNYASNTAPEQMQRVAEECYGEVLAYCRRHAPAGCDPEDLARDTFLGLVQSGTYSEWSSPAGPLMRTARAICIDASPSQTLETTEPDSAASGGEGKGDKTAFLGEALERLSADQREAVELKFGAGLEEGDVAKVLGISRTAATRRIQAALKALEWGVWGNGVHMNDVERVRLKIALSGHYAAKRETPALETIERLVEDMREESDRISHARRGGRVV